MADQEIVLRLTHDQALVLSDWLYRVMGTQPFDGLVNADPAVWSALYTIGGVLETTLPEIFAADYATRLAAARQRLLAHLGRTEAEPEDV